MAQFRKRQSGNPSGKPKGCRNTTTILFDELLKANAKELIEKAIEMAKDGDGPALRLCIERLAPARKDRPVWFDLPEMNEARDGVNASAAIVEAVATGELTPAAKLLTKDEARRIAPSKRRDLFIHCGVYLEDIGKPDEAAENPCETDIWYRCFSSGDIVWNFDQPSFWRCSLVRGEKPWKRRVLGLPIPHVRSVLSERLG